MVEDALRALGVEYEEPYGSSWATARCPLHYDERPSFTVDLESGGWLCRSGCGSSGDLAYLVEAVTGEPAATARLRLRRGLALDPEALQRALRREPAAEAVEAVDPDLAYERGRVPQYFFRRGFTRETARDWDVGWDADLRALVVPVRDDRFRTVGLVRRRLDGEPKYQNSRGLSKADVLFGLDHVPFHARSVAVVEGPLDAMWLHQLGYPAVATLGASLSRSQAATLARRFWRVVLAYDADPAGRAASRRAREFLSRVDVAELTLPPGRKDVQECSEAELAEAFAAVGVVGLHEQRDVR